MANKTPDNVVQFNDQNFFFELLLINSKGQTFNFNNAAIEELVIEDSLFDWQTTGTLIFKNNFDAIERTYKNGNEISVGYEFGTTNRDYLFLRCIPTFLDEYSEDGLDPNIWELNYAFVIYDFEDIQGKSPEDKFKKLYFWDASYESFVQKNIHFSSSLLNKGETDVPPSQQTDDQRSDYTGNIIKELIKATLSENEVFLDTEEKNKWDKGRDKIFYSSHPKNYAIDDLKYLLNRHVSTEETNNDPCILSNDRYTNEWSLIPFSNYFDKAINSVDRSLPSTLQLESFFISEYGKPDDDNPKVAKRVPAVSKNPNLQLNIHLSDYSLIDKYQIFDMSLFDKANYLNTHVAHSYNFGDKEFVIKQRESNIESAYEHFKENYADKLNFADYQNSPLFNVDNLRRYNKNIKHVFKTGYSSNNPMYAIGRNKILFTSLGLNTTIQFMARGLTHRKSGHFIGISKKTDYYDSEYEAKLQGQWLLTKVEHRFTKNSYTNNMFGVKVNKLRVSEDDE
jgi:hypothetical protein